MKRLFLILLCFPLFLLAQPTITNFSPTMGLVGSSVTIYGSGFSTTTSIDNTVFFGGIEATIVSNTSTEIIVTVPNSIPYAPISVYTDSLVSVSSELFNVLFTAIAPLQVSDFSHQLYNPYLGQKYYDVKMADINGDGIPEIVTSESASSNAYLAIFKTSFDSIGLMSIDDRLEINFGTGVYSSPQDIAIGDLNGDGLLDIVVSEEGDATDDFQAHTCIFINNSESQNYSFEPPIIIPGEGYEAFVQLHDINGDGKLDIVTSRNIWNQLGIYLNTSNNNNISFANKMVIPEAIGIKPAFSDLNGDGLVDMVATVHYGNNREVYIYSNNSTVSNINFILEDSVLAGGFPPPGPNDWNWSSSFPTLVDLDGDDKLDIVVTNGNCGIGCSPSGISVIRNISTSSALNFNYNYSDWYPYQTDTWPIRTNVSDLNGDGKPDLLTNDWKGGVSILVNSSTLGNISLNSQLEVGVGAYPLAIATSDLNMDGTPDIVVPNWELEGLRIHHNFINQPVTSSIYACDSLKVTDVIIDNAALTMNIGIYNDYNFFLNYPYVALTLDANGDTIQEGNMSSFGAWNPDTTWYNYSINSAISPSYPLTIYFVYAAGGFLASDTCILTYNSTPIASWDCINGVCIDPGTGNGTYTTLIDCEYLCNNVSIEEIGLTNFKIFPNPSSYLFNISFSSNKVQDLKVRIFNSISEVVMIIDLKQYKGEYTKQINLTNNAKGIYFLEIGTNDGFINKKLVLQ